MIRSRHAFGLATLPLLKCFLQKRYVEAGITSGVRDLNSKTRNTLKHNAYQNLGIQQHHLANKSGENNLQTLHSRQYPLISTSARASCFVSSLLSPSTDMTRDETITKEPATTIIQKIETAFPHESIGHDKWYLVAVSPS